MNKKDIMNDLEQFITDLINYMGSGINVPAAIRKAQAKYIPEFPRSLLYPNRQRGPLFPALIETVESFGDDRGVRIKGFKTFVTDGKWKKTSANTCLLIHLTKEMGGYFIDESYFYRQLPLVQTKLLKKLELEELRMGRIEQTSDQSALSPRF